MKTDFSSGKDERIALINARLIDPLSKFDEPGTLIIENRRIADFGANILENLNTKDMKVIDCEGNCLIPGLVDLRAHLREPGAEHKENLSTASKAAAAGGITSVVCMPNTDPVIDQIALIEFIARRSRETSMVKVYPAAAITKNLEGKELTEIGLLLEAGAVAFSDADRAGANSLVMR